MAKWSQRLGETANPVQLAAELSEAMSALTPNTRRLQRSLSAAIESTGYSSHIIIGDGQSYQKAGNDNRWPNLLRTTLSDAGIPVGGTGWVRPGDGFNDVDSRFTKTGTWTNFGGPYLQTTTNGATLEFTSDVAGTAISVAYFNSSADFNVSVDGGADVLVEPTAGANSVETYTVTGLADTTHTVTITTTSTEFTFIIGVNVYGGSGLIFHNWAGFGWNSTYYGSTSFPTAGFVLPRLIPDPDVVHIAPAFGDSASSTAIATFTANLEAIRNYWPDADAVFHVGYQASGDTDWPDYVDAVYEAADATGAVVVDMYARNGGYTTANGNGLMADTSYPSTAGHTDWAYRASTLIDLGAVLPGFTGVSAGIPLGTPSSGDLTNCTLPLGEWTPAAYTWKGWTYDPVHITGETNVVAGYPYISGIQIPAATTIENILIYVTALDSGLTSGQNFVALYQGGNLLGTSADQTSAWASTGLKTAAISGGPVAVSAGLIYVARFANGNTTLRFGKSDATYSAAVNAAGITRYAYVNPGGLTTTMSATISSGNFVANANSMWAAVS